MAIGRDEICSGTFHAIYDIINTDKSSYPVTVVSLYSQYPDVDLDKRTDFPCIIVSRANTGGETIVSKDVRIIPVTVDIVIESTNAKHLDSLGNSVINSLQTKEDQFSTINVYNIKVSSISNADLRRTSSATKVHQKTITVEFESDYMVS